MSGTVKYVRQIVNVWIADNLIYKIVYNEQINRQDANDLKHNNYIYIFPALLVTPEINYAKSERNRGASPIMNNCQ